MQNVLSHEKEPLNENEALDDFNFRITRKFRHIYTNICKIFKEFEGDF